MRKKPVIGISIGDINGIGPEIIIKTCSDSRIHQHCTPVIFGSSKVLNYYKKALDLPNFKFDIQKNAGQVNQKVTNVVNVQSDDVDIKIGESTESAGKFALVAIDYAVEALKLNQIDALVTAPLNKNNVALSSKNFVGHTEYLQHAFESSNSLMFMVNSNIRVGVATGHIPLRHVHEKLSQESILNKVKIMYKSLKNDFNISKPRIAILGLNPHAGDGGLIGKEEIEMIEPVIQDCKNKGIIAMGPFPADGFFGSSSFLKFDGVLAMYHDQGLIPFKSLAFGEGVNFTAGLPFVRTSPDHGTAYDLAGKGVASADSFRSAIFSAIDISNNRKTMSGLMENSIQKAVLNTEI